MVNPGTPQAAKPTLVCRRHSIQAGHSHFLWGVYPIDHPKVDVGMDLQAHAKVAVALQDQTMEVVDQAQTGMAMVVDHLTPILLEAHTSLEEARGVQCMQ